MAIHLRQISLYFRRRRSAAEGREILAKFLEWRELLKALPPPRSGDKRLLIVRLDDIGDYLLFRNQLRGYKRSSRWRDHAVVLLGNESWKEIYAAVDEGAVDEVIWVNKGRYLTSAAYRWDVWRELRNRGFAAVIAASCTRPLLLDDLCLLAAAPQHSEGSRNTNVHPEWNAASDALYGRLFDAGGALLHEFEFNARFAAWSCGVRYEGSRPSLESVRAPPRAEPYILCFVGANTRSKRWPLQRWVEFIKLYRRCHADMVFLAGASPGEIQVAQSIQSRTVAQSMAGQLSLPELMAWVAGARAVITNDTMAAHLGASLRRPTLIVANGVNYVRFTEYARAGIDGVATVYPDVFNRRRARQGDFSYAYADAVSADIESIRGRVVLDRLNELAPVVGPG